MSESLKTLPVKTGERVLRLWFLVIIFLLIFFLLPGFSSPVFGEPRTETHSIEPASPVGPDIFIESLVVEPRTGGRSPNRTATVVITNRGNLMSEKFSLNFFQDLETAPGPFHKYDKSKNIAGMFPGLRNVVTFEFTYGYGLEKYNNAWVMAKTKQTKNNEYPVYGPYRYAGLFSINNPAQITIESFDLEPVTSDLGDELTATIVVRNEGDLETNTNFYVDFYPDQDDEPGPNEWSTDFMKNINMGFAPGAYEVIVFKFTPTEIGSKQAWVQADTNDQVSGPVVKGPFIYTVEDVVEDTGDIVIESMTVEPATSEPGTELIATITMKNNGNTVSAPFNLFLFLDRETAPVPGEFADMGLDIPPLDPGNDYTCSFFFTPLATGSYQAWAMVEFSPDPASYYYTYGPVPYEVVDPVNDFVNIVIDDMTIEPSPSEPGTELTATIDLKNEGNIASDNFYLDFYYDKDSPPDPGEEGDDWRFIFSIDPGETRTETFTFDHTEAGRYQAWARAQTLQTATGEDYIYGPVPYEVVDSVDDFVNIVMVDMYIDPLTSEPDTDLTATIVLKNEGNTASEDFYLDFYYDKNSPPDPGEEGDDRSFITSLAPDETYSETFTFTQAEDGTYQAWARAQTLQTASGDYPILDFVYFAVEDFDGHFIHSFDFDPTWPVELEYGDDVNYYFEYTTTNQGEVYVLANAMTEEGDSPMQLSSDDKLPSGTDIGNGSFRILDEGQSEALVISQVKFEMHCAEKRDDPDDIDSLLYDVLVDVDYTYVPPGSDVEPPAIPSLTSPGHGEIVTGSSVVLNWAPVEGATHYAVWIYNLTKDEKVIYTDPIEENSYTYEGLADDGDIYAWSVVANNIDDQIWGDFAVPIAFINGSDAELLPPTLTSPSHRGTVSETNVLLQWEASPGADLYTIVVADLNTGEYLDGYDGSQLFEGTYHVLEGLSGGGTTYYWSICAADSSTPGLFSDYAFPWLFTSEQVLKGP